MTSYHTPQVPTVKVAQTGSGYRVRVLHPLVPEVSLPGGETPEHAERVAANVRGMLARAQEFGRHETQEES